MGHGFIGLTFTSEEWCMAYPDGFRLHTYYLWRIRAAVYSTSMLFDMLGLCHAEFWGIQSKLFITMRVVRPTVS